MGRSVSAKQKPWDIRAYGLAVLRFLLHILHQTRRRRVPEIRQMDATECGAACLAMILSYYGRKTSVSEIRERCGVGRDGLSAYTIATTAREYDLRVRAVSLQHNDFRHVTLPAIIHWEFAHFLVVERWTEKWVEVVDPAGGRRRLSAGEFDEGFTGVVMMMEPGIRFSRRSTVAQLSLWAYLWQMFRAPGILLQVLGTSLLLQLAGLTVPVLTKVFVDQIVPNGMKDVMMVLGLGVLVLILAQTVVTLLRSTLLIYLQAHIDTQMMLNFFEHLLTLPFRFFQQRLSGDLLARLSSNNVIRDMLTNQLISAILDGSFVSVYLIILFSQSTIFAITALSIGLAQVCILLGTTRLVRDLAKRELAAQGTAQGYMNEALNGIATLKAAGVEARSLSHWTNLFCEQLNVSMRRDYVGALVDTALGLLRTLSPLLLLWLGTMQVLAGTMSIGTMLALNALVTAFLSPLASLVNNGQRLQQIRAHFERIADVIEAQPEQETAKVARPPKLQGQIELKQVSFRYDPHADMVLHDITLTIQPGQKIALVGHTGSGKSTLGKLLLGLYTPTEGEILYDHLPLHELNYQAVRNQFGVVLQESSIFSGSVRDNIAFNDPSLNMERIVEVAQMAAIHDDIAQMRMQYNTFVSEAGSALSGGQRQRLAIARALAHQPAILLFDEATSHLDVITEKRVEQNLRNLACTRIIIAHRLSTIRDADTILVLDQGRIVERGTHDELLRLHGHYARLVQHQVTNSQVKTEALDVYEAVSQLP